MVDVDELESPPAIGIALRLETSAIGARCVSAVLRHPGLPMPACSSPNGVNFRWPLLFAYASGVSVRYGPLSVPFGEVSFVVRLAELVIEVVPMDIMTETSVSLSRS